MNSLDAYRLAVAIAGPIAVVLMFATVPFWRWQRPLERVCLMLCPLVAIGYFVSALLGKPMHYFFVAVWLGITGMRIWTWRMNERTRALKAELAARP